MKCIWRRQIIRLICVGLMFLAADGFADEPKKDAAVESSMQKSRKNLIKIHMVWKSNRPDNASWNAERLWEGLPRIGAGGEWINYFYGNTGGSFSLDYISNSEDKMHTQAFPAKNYLKYRLLKTVISVVNHKKIMFGDIMGGLGVGYTGIFYKNEIFHIIKQRALSIELKVSLSTPLTSFWEKGILFIEFNTNRVIKTWRENRIQYYGNDPNINNVNLASGTFLKLGIGMRF